MAAHRLDVGVGPGDLEQDGGGARVRRPRERGRERAPPRPVLRPGERVEDGRPQGLDHSRGRRRSQDLDGREAHSRVRVSKEGERDRRLGGTFGEGEERLAPETGGEVERGGEAGEGAGRGRFRDRGRRVQGAAPRARVRREGHGALEVGDEVQGGRGGGRPGGARGGRRRPDRGLEPGAAGRRSTPARGAGAARPETGPPAPADRRSGGPVSTRTKAASPPRARATAVVRTRAA